MAKTKIQRLRDELRNLNHTLAETQARRDEVADQLQQCENNEIRWTDHGLLRYLTRVKGWIIDDEALLAEIITDDLQDLVNKLGGRGRFPCDGYTVILKDHCIITVLTPKANKP